MGNLAKVIATSGVAVASACLPDTIIAGSKEQRNTSGSQLGELVAEMKGGGFADGLLVVGLRE